MKSLKINYLFFILCCFVSLSCSLSGPRYSGPTYEVDASTINGVVNHFEAQYDNKWFPGNFTPSIQPRVILNDQYALFRWKVNPSDNYNLVKVDIFKNMPPGFRDNTENMLLFNLFEDQRPHVGYKMWLSDITYKTIYHPETPQERAQRELDEKMWLALKNGELEKVRYYVNKGANVEQPWMNKVDKPIWGFVADFQNAKLVDLFIRKGKKYHFNLYDVACYWDIPGLTKIAKKYKANPNEIVEIFVEGKEMLTKAPVILSVTLNNKAHYIKALLNDGANVDFNINNIKNVAYWKPWHNKPFLTWAKHNTRPDIYRLLASYSKRARRH